MSFGLDSTFKKELYTSALEYKMSLNQFLMKYDEQYEFPFMKMMSHLQLLCRAVRSRGAGGQSATQISGGIVEAPVIYTVVL